ncbi:MAG: DUF6766 family protein, partial [Friedmanniella sp.]
MKRFVGENSLTLAFGLILLLALVGQSVAGLADFNDQQLSQGQEVITYLQYLTSSDFAVDVAENWQSEFLQFFLFIVATIWLVQRGSPESKKPGDEGPGDDRDQKVGEFAEPDSPEWAKRGGLSRVIFSNSLLLAMGSIFLLSWLAQSLAGVVVYNSENVEHGQAPVAWLDYLSTPDFWNRTLQNWQSEFLAVGTRIAFSIFLRQRGS